MPEARRGLRRLPRSGSPAAAAIDFDEQIYSALEALLRDGRFRRRMQAAHRHLLVDEFQDLTPAHVLLIRLLAMPALDVFGVGDDDQTIYDHAGADPRFLVDYARLLPRRRGDGARGQLPLREADRRRRPRPCSATTGSGSRRRSARARAPTPRAAGDLRIDDAPAGEAAERASSRWSREWRAARSVRTASGSRFSPASTRCCWRRRSRSGRRACRCAQLRPAGRARADRRRRRARLDQGRGRSGGPDRRSDLET